ncbi:Fatty acyl-CoA reductase wat [Eumeta japonica]|uniref:Fatty acyl-CoA reductase n=1 Tax=Eumeta variegata TaxID=151549 RepID=A0A4C1Z0M4_EUMVA|nr:Fatty acyl-CoA reductase wat [Eumeta japonica]
MSSVDRSCPDIQKILLLARSKKDKDPSTRLQEQYDDTLYDKLRRMQPNFIQKIEIIEGDVGKKGLGLNDVDRNKITEEVHVIFHGAATVRLDETLKLAIETNTRGTKEMFLLAKSCTKLTAFVQISTSYRSKIGEVFYDAPLPTDKVIDLVDILDDELLEKFKKRIPVCITCEESNVVASVNGILVVLLVGVDVEDQMYMYQNLVGEYPNTYTYSKALAEDVVRQHSKILPVAVVRPSMVISTASEPVAGWIDNVYGPTGVTVGAGLGLLHSLHCDPNKKADLVPGDYVVNAIIAAAWRTAREYSGNGEDAPSDPAPPIYNVVSSVDNPLTWRQVQRLGDMDVVKVMSESGMVGRKT